MLVSLLRRKILVLARENICGLDGRHLWLSLLLGKTRGTREIILRSVRRRLAILTRRTELPIPIHVSILAQATKFAKNIYNITMNDAKEEIRSKLAIEDVIGEYVQLKRSGRYWRGLSPFTQERTPSFFVTPDRDIWHDFSSGQGGDIFSFVMQVEGVDFRGAMEILAKKSGVDLSKYDSRAPKDLGRRKERIYEMNSLAVNYFQHEMTREKSAMEYIFANRKLTKETVLQWGIGFAPENSRLKNLLISRKFDEKEIREAGLISERKNEMFRSRMMIPLRDSVGQIVGFTGRIVGPGEPKYLNTPGTLVYDKGRQIFGLNFAKMAIREKNFAILVEGNLDVISSSQAGVKNIVAAAGTALTKDHLKSLQRLTRNIRLCFDGDRAGIAATERAINLSQDLDLKLEVIDWSDYEKFAKNPPKDPDEILNNFGVQVWEEVVNKMHSPAVDWVINHYVRGEDIATADGQKVVSDRSLALIKNLRDEVEQEFYVKKVAKILRVSEDSLFAKMRGETFAKKTETGRKFLRESKLKLAARERKNEEFYINMIFALAYKFPRIASVTANVPDEYLSELFAKIKYFLLNREVKAAENEAKITSEMADKMAELEMIAERSFGENFDERLALMTNMNELEKLKIRGKFESLSSELANVLEAGETDKARLINGAVNGLKKDLVAIEKSNSRNDFDGLRDLWKTRKEK